jgi:PAS domain S-box-containing protein
MPHSRFSLSPATRDYLHWLVTSHLEALTLDYMRRVRAYDLPMLRFFAGIPEADQLAMNRASLSRFIQTLVDGTALQVAAEGLRRWEADEIPGIPKAGFEPRDLILVSAAHERAILAFLETYTDDRAVAITAMGELRDYFLQAELNAYEVFTRIRDEAVERSARAEAEREAASRRLIEIQALNEELMAQQEELNALYAQLQEHSRGVEQEVLRRTEELHAVNEELQAANEEMESHHEELLAANEQLNEQATALAEQSAFLEKLVRHVPTGIAYLDRHQIFRWVNPPFAGFAGKHESEFRSRSYYDVFPFIENPNPRLTSVLESGRPNQVAGLGVPMPDGEVTYWDIVYVPVFDHAGEVDGLLLLSQDATERVRREQGQQQRIDHLQEVDRLKNDFLSILSHELRTPINAIMGFASVLDDEVPGPLNAAQHHHTRRILGGADVLLALIEDLLDMSRMQAGKFSLSPAPIAPGAVIEDALAALSHLAEQKGQVITLTKETELAPLEADSQRLRQVITNLVGNAIKFGAEGDRIAVRAQSTPAGLRCEVEDHGEGIAEADLPKLFQRFTQLDTGNTRRAGGAGLGLSIVKALVEAHGGEVGVESVPGIRTVFWFTLPAAPTAAPSHADTV